MVFYKRKQEHGKQDKVTKESSEGQMKASIKRSIFDYSVSIIICIVLAVIIRNYVITRADVDGRSMNPTLKDKDIVFVEKISTLSEKYKRGSIIIFDAPRTDHDIYIKRVVGVAGDKIEIKNGKVYLNGKELEEKYLAEGTVTKRGTFMADKESFIVPKGYIFVMGDNRDFSEDSRAFGPVKLDAVKGRAIVRVFPMKTIKIL